MLHARTFINYCFFTKLIFNTHLIRSIYEYSVINCTMHVRPNLLWRNLNTNQRLPLSDELENKEISEVFDYLNSETCLLDDQRTHLTLQNKEKNFHSKNSFNYFDKNCFFGCDKMQIYDQNLDHQYATNSQTADFEKAGMSENDSEEVDVYEDREDKKKYLVRVNPLFAIKDEKPASILSQIDIKSEKKRKRSFSNKNTAGNMQKMQYHQKKSKIDDSTTVKIETTHMVLPELAFISADKKNIQPLQQITNVQEEILHFSIFDEKNYDNTKILEAITDCKRMQTYQKKVHKLEMKNPYDVLNRLVYENSRNFFSSLNEKQYTAFIKQINESGYLNKILSENDKLKIMKAFNFIENVDFYTNYIAFNEKSYEKIFFLYFNILEPLRKFQEIEVTNLKTKLCYNLDLFLDIIIHTKKLIAKTISIPGFDHHFISFFENNTQTEYYKFRQDFQKNMETLCLNSPNKNKIQLSKDIFKLLDPLYKTIDDKKILFFNKLNFDVSSFQSIELQDAFRKFIIDFLLSKMSPDIKINILLNENNTDIDLFLVASEFIFKESLLFIVSFLFKKFDNRIFTFLKKNIISKATKYLEQNGSSHNDAHFIKHIKLEFDQAINYLGFYEFCINFFLFLQEKYQKREFDE